MTSAAILAAESDRASGVAKGAVSLDGYQPFELHRFELRNGQL